jgi:paraquat-inducible protein B
VSDDTVLKEAHRTSPARATTHRSWWPGWIWAVPIAALAIGGWLLLRFLTQGGTEITIVFPDVYGIDPSSTSIEFRGMTVGTVRRVSLTSDGSAVKVNATIQDSAAPFLRSGTRFWLRGANLSLSNLSSLGAVLSGPTIMMEPGSGKSSRDFTGLTRKPAIPLNSGAPVLFSVSFGGSVGDLSPGDPIKLRGFPVGEVRQIAFRYDMKTGMIATPVTVALYPGLFHMGPETDRESTETFRGALNRLVEAGLRANLEREPPLIGGYRVGLEITPGAPAASLKIVNGMPEIPVAPGGGLQAIVSRLGKLPIDQIAQNILDLTHHIDQVVSSPKLTESVAELDASLQEIHNTLKDVGPKVDQLVQSLRNAAKQLDQASAAADKAMGGATSQTGLGDTMREVKEAARAVRSLADYLEQHPEALISGKHGQ